MYSSYLLFYIFVFAHLRLYHKLSINVKKNFLTLGRIEIRRKSLSFVGKMAVSYHGPRLYDGRTLINKSLQSVDFTMASIIIICRIYQRCVQSVMDYFTVSSKIDIYWITPDCLTVER